MSVVFKQANRIGRLTTVLGQDVLFLNRFDGVDHLNDLFSYQVQAFATRDDIDLEALIGTHATVEALTREGHYRPFDGIVTQCRWAGASENGMRYDLTLSPWFWLAGKRRNQRIFHNRTVVEILQELLADYARLGDPAVEMALKADYPKLEYTVQYHESDLDFARRQMERHGISFYFRHALGGHTLVLTDDELAHDLVGSRPLKVNAEHNHYEQEYFWSWTAERNLTTGAIKLTDYNFKAPFQAMEQRKAGDAGHLHSDIESFDYPGDFTSQATGKPVVARRIRQERGADHRARAIGDCATLGGGLRVTLNTDTALGNGETFMCLTASHSLTSLSYGSNTTLGSDRAFTGSYVLMPAKSPLAPPRITALPRIHGPQTAFVIGDGEVDCDDFGRVLVQFHWDLEMAQSMRCRVSQSWAARGWGSMTVPRVGMEVVVEFLEGDPDKPLVTGCVYNAANMPPATLPQHKTRSVFKTNSVQGSGFNELTFEDKSGDEFIYIHAQKNLDLHVKNSRNKRVEFDDTASIGNNSSLAVAANRTETINGKMDLAVKGVLSEKIDGDRNLTVGGAWLNKAGGDLVLKSDGEVVIDASRITLVAGGAAIVIEGGAVNVTPVLNVGAASPGAGALPTIPLVLRTAAGEGMPFVSHCPSAA